MIKNKLINLSLGITGHWSYIRKVMTFTILWVYHMMKTNNMI